MTGTGAADTSSARPPSYADALPDDLWSATPEAQAAFKVALSNSNGTRPSGQPGLTGSMAGSDATNAFQKAYAKLTGRS